MFSLRGSGCRRPPKPAARNAAAADGHARTRDRERLLRRRRAPADRRRDARPRGALETEQAGTPNADALLVVPRLNISPWSSKPRRSSATAVSTWRQVERGDLALRESHDEAAARLAPLVHDRMTENTRRPEADRHALPAAEPAPYVRARSRFRPCPRGRQASASPCATRSLPDRQLPQPPDRRRAHDVRPGELEHYATRSSTPTGRSTARPRTRHSSR